MATSWPIYQSLSVLTHIHNCYQPMNKRGWGGGGNDHYLFVAKFVKIIFSGESAIRWISLSVPLIVCHFARYCIRTDQISERLRGDDRTQTPFTTKYQDQRIKTTTSFGRYHLKRFSSLILQGCWKYCCCHGYCLEVLFYVFCFFVFCFLLLFYSFLFVHLHFFF